MYLPIPLLSTLLSSLEFLLAKCAMSTLHAIFITNASLYFVLWSDLYSNNEVVGPITLRRSTFSSFTLGVSTGYFFSDLGMILWFYPSLGGMEYVIHHLLSVVGVSYAMLTGEGQLYTYMMLISEATTPWINLRWYLDEAGMKNSRVYLTNGIVIFIAWLVARILWFVYLFYHTYVHYDQLEKNGFETTRSKCTLSDIRRIHSCYPPCWNTTGEANAYNWSIVGTCGSLCFICDEFGVVWENIQRVEENYSKKEEEPVNRNCEYNITQYLCE